MNKLSNEVMQWIWNTPNKGVHYSWPEGQLFDFLRARCGKKVYLSALELLLMADTEQCPFSQNEVGLLLKYYNVGIISTIGD